MLFGGKALNFVHNIELSCTAVEAYSDSVVHPQPPDQKGRQGVSSNDLLCAILRLLTLA